MARFQILSLIGGGIRGAFITSFLNKIEQKLGRPVAESFDLIAGTSTGGIIAAGLSAGLSAAEMHDFYVRYGAKIFSTRRPYRAKGIYRFLFPLANWVFKKKTGGGLDAAFRARFCPDTLQKSFNEGLGDRTLGSVNFTRLIIPVVNLSRGQPRVFRSLHLPGGKQDRNVKISEALIAATAAPTYFPHREINGEAYVDGGVWAVDPSMLAFCEAIRVQQMERGLENFSHCDIDEIHLLSIGTGRAEYSLSPPGPDAGLLYWATRVAELMGTSQVEGIHMPLEFLLGERYQHVNFQMDELWGLDDVTHIPQLFEKGNEVAEEEFVALKESFLCHHRKQFTPCSLD